MKFNVYGISSWHESENEMFLIFKEKEFKNQEDAVIAAKQAYSEKLEVHVEECN